MSGIGATDMHLINALVKFSGSISDFAKCQKSEQNARLIVLTYRLLVLSVHIWGKSAKRKMLLQKLFRRLKPSKLH